MKTLLMLSILSASAQASVTFKNPKFDTVRYGEEQRERINCNSDQDAVCVFLGLKHALEFSCKTKEVNQFFAKINGVSDCLNIAANGGLSELCDAASENKVFTTQISASDRKPFFRAYSESSKTSYSVIKTITCE